MATQPSTPSSDTNQSAAADATQAMAPNTTAPDTNQTQRDQSPEPDASEDAPRLRDTYNVGWAVQGNILFLPEERIVTSRFDEIFGQQMTSWARMLLGALKRMKDPANGLGDLGVFKHPFVILSRPVSDPSIVTVAVMTTFKERDLEERLGGQFLAEARDAHIPIEPAPVHPNGHKPLRLENGVFEKASWLRTNRKWKVPLEVFDSWDRALKDTGTVRCRLDEDSFKFAIQHINRYSRLIPEEQYTAAVGPTLNKLMGKTQQAPFKELDKQTKANLIGLNPDPRPKANFKQVCEVGLNPALHVLDPEKFGCGFDLVKVETEATTIRRLNVDNGSPKESSGNPRTSRTAEEEVSFSTTEAPATKDSKPPTVASGKPDVRKSQSSSKSPAPTLPLPKMDPSPSTPEKWSNSRLGKRTPLRESFSSNPNRMTPLRDGMMNPERQPSRPDGGPGFDRRWFKPKLPGDNPGGPPWPWMRRE